ncbi:MAG: hypothetical protein ABIA74_02960 [bacterium]
MNIKKYFLCFLFMLFINNIFAIKNAPVYMNPCKVNGVVYTPFDVGVMAYLFCEQDYIDLNFEKKLCYRYTFSLFTIFFMKNSFNLLMSSYNSLFDKQEPYNIICYDSKKADSLVFYRKAILGLFTLRKDLFCSLNNYYFLYDIVLHADYRLFKLFMENIVPKDFKIAFLNIVCTGRQETFLDVVVKMKYIVRNALIKKEYEKIEKYLRKNGGLSFVEICNIQKAFVEPLECEEKLLEAKEQLSIKNLLNPKS